MTTRTPTIDSQVHAYERNRPERPWSGFLEGPDEVTGDDMVAAMDSVGVDGALLVSPFSMYGYDASYALEVYAKHPGSFGLIKPFDPQSEATADEMVEWTGLPGVVGARIMLAYQPFEANDPGLNRILAAGALVGVPVNVLCWGKLPLMGELARRHPNTQVVIDHVGLVQPFKPPHRRNRLLTWPMCFHWPNMTTWPSRFPEPAPCPASHFRTRTSGGIWARCSMRSASIDACGVLTGPGRLTC